MTSGWETHKIFQQAKNQSVAIVDFLTTTKIGILFNLLANFTVDPNNEARIASFGKRRQGIYSAHHRGGLMSLYLSVFESSLAKLISDKETRHLIISPSSSGLTPF